MFRWVLLKQVSYGYSTMGHLLLRGGLLDAVEAGYRQRRTVDFGGVCCGHLGIAVREARHDLVFRAASLSHFLGNHFTDPMLRTGISDGPGDCSVLLQLHDLRQFLLDDPLANLVVERA
jgi:hypothetical protein